MDTLSPIGYRISMKRAHFQARLEATSLGKYSPRPVTNRLIDLGIHRIPDPNGYHVPLVDAVLYSATVNIETVQKLLLSGVDVHQVRLGDQTALSVAVEKENRQLISLLLKHGADIHHIPDDGEVEGSALACAVRYSSLDLLKFLLKEDVDVNREANHIGTSLQVAVSSPRIDVVKLLLTHNADVCTRDGRYGTVLHLSASNSSNSEDMVRLLLSCGADKIIDELDNDGKTALYRAISFQPDTGVVDLLLERGLDPNLEGAESSNPLHRAILRHEFGFVDRLLQKGAHGDSARGPFYSALECATFAGDEGLFRRLLKRDQSVLSRPHNSSRILQRAILGNKHNITSSLLRTCENLDDRDEHGWTVYTCAMHVRSKRVLTMLGLENEDMTNVSVHVDDLSTPTSWNLTTISAFYVRFLRSENSQLVYIGKLCAYIF
jgi:ankyrin repeat protein